MKGRAQGQSCSLANHMTPPVFLFRGSCDENERVHNFETSSCTYGVVIEMAFFSGTNLTEFRVPLGIPNRVNIGKEVDGGVGSLKF